MSGQGADMPGSAVAAHEFPLVEALSSGDSAEALAPLFAALTGRTASSDFFKPFVIGFGFLHSLRGPTTTSGAV